MQSQQKRVKWSRGETAEALEERTDTGITNASVEYMENCIPDIYGNISRRPALKAIPLANNFTSSGNVYTGFDYTTLYFIPFYYTEKDYFLIGIKDGAPEIIRIKNGKIVKKRTISGVYPVSSDGIPSYSQQNNYLVVANNAAVYKLQITDINGTDFTPTCDVWKFSAGWYAPNGTQTQQVNNSTLPGLAFDGHFYSYTYTAYDGTTTVYSNVDTGIDGAANISAIEEQIPVGSIVQMPNIGCYFRVEGYYTEDDNTYFSDVTFDSVQVLDADDPAPAAGTGHVCVARNGHGLQHYNNGVFVESADVPRYDTAVVKCSASGTGYYSNVRHEQHVAGLTLYLWGTWQEFDASDSSVRAYGALLTPVADDTATDSIVSVETGYTSLQPSSWETNLFPHPKKVAFIDQRLWAGAWAYSLTQEYALTIGSQIARYNDFKNDYNQENEAITLDILTQFKEKILHLVNYNGLKIMTNAYEYTYENGAVIKQSANGSLETCSPLVFDSLCLYVDSTGCQIKAMQYEFQANIFNSSTINQLAPHNLIWYPIGLAAYEDKIHNTGKYLFVLNENNALTPNGVPRLAVCNFVPTNQANIWSRWSFPTTNISGTNQSVLANIINMKNETLFMLRVDSTLKPSGESEGVGSKLIIPAVLDFEANCDYETPLVNKQVLIYTYTNTSGTVSKAVLSNATVDIFADGVYKFTTTTNSTGYITDDISQLSNVTAGYKINSLIRSHPIDVGGKTKSVMKRIGKAQMSVHDTSAGAITINNKTGYMNPRIDHICFYGVTGMKDEIKYTITNKNGAMFHLESLLMNIEYGTLDS